MMDHRCQPANALFPALAGLLALALAGCSAAQTGSTPPAAPEMANVEMKDTHFLPATLTVKAGTEVMWTNHDGFGHTVTAEDGAFDSGVLEGGTSWHHTFDRPGTYTYYCKPHSSGSSGNHAGMTAQIVVT